MHDNQAKRFEVQMSAARGSDGFLASGHIGRGIYMYNYIYIYIYNIYIYIPAAVSRLRIMFCRQR